jgi:hypothetical protein
MAGKKRVDASDQQERLIELFQEEPDLWNVSSASYSKKDMRQKAQRNIVDKLQEEYESRECNGKFITFIQYFYSHYFKS